MVSSSNAHVFLIEFVTYSFKPTTLQITQQFTITSPTQMAQIKWFLNAGNEMKNIIPKYLSGESSSFESWSFMVLFMPLFWFFYLSSISNRSPNTFSSLLTGHWISDNKSD